jgi:protein-disulfide isomerase/uncharacterized membrane protein
MSKQKSSKKRRGKESAQPAVNTKMMWASVVIAGVGALMALYLANLTFTIAANGIESTGACSINEWVNCDLVQASSHARMLGVPVAWWGLLFYVFAGLSALYGAIGKKSSSSAPYVAAAFVLAIFSVLFSVYKAYNLYDMGLLCPVCVGMYVANLGLLFTLPMGLGKGVSEWGSFLTSYVKAAMGKESNLDFEPKIVSVGVLFIALFLVGGAAARQHQKGMPGADTVDTERSVADHFRQTPKEIKTSDDAPVWGNPDAKITIVEFADFQCPACQQAAAFFKPTLAEFEDDVKLIFMNFPLPNHAMARGAASAAICGQQFGDFWGVHDKIFQNQATLGVSLYESIAEDNGWDTGEFKACMASSSVRDRIERELELGAEAQLPHTPYILINGRKLSGWHIADHVRAVINEEMSRQQ